MASLEAFVKGEPGVQAVLYEMVSASRHSEEIRLELAELYRRWRELLAGALRAKEREGVVKLDADPDSVASVLFALGDGMGLQLSSDPGWASQGPLEVGARTARRLLGAESSTSSAPQRSYVAMARSDSAVRTRPSPRSPRAGGQLVGVPALDDQRAQALDHVAHRVGASERLHQRREPVEGHEVRREEEQREEEQEARVGGLDVARAQRHEDPEAGVADAEERREQHEQHGAEGPLSMCAPRASPARSTTIEPSTPRTKSEARRPMMIDERRIGAASSLSK